MPQSQRKTSPHFDLLPNILLCQAANVLIPPGMEQNKGHAHARSRNKRKTPTYKVALQRPLFRLDVQVLCSQVVPQQRCEISNRKQNAGAGCWSNSYTLNPPSYHVSSTWRLPLLDTTATTAVSLCLLLPPTWTPRVGCGKKRHRIKYYYMYGPSLSSLLLPPPRPPAATYVCMACSVAFGLRPVAATAAAATAFSSR